VVLPANASTVLATIPSTTWTDRCAQMPFASLEANGQVVARNRLYVEFFKDLCWPAATITVQVTDGQAIFTSPTFVWGVCLDLDGEAQIADNFFDLYPGVPYAIPWTQATPPQVLFTGNLA
jgi:beta-mannosidase